MDFINNLIKLGGTPTVLCGAFIICLLGYAIGSIKVKGVELGTAGVFLMALLFGYLFTLPGLKDIPVLGSFYIESAKSSAVTSYKFIESIGLVLFVTGVGSIAGPNFFRDLKKNAKSYVPLGAVIILIGAAVAVVFALIPGIGADYSNGILSGALTYPFGVIGLVLFVQIIPKILHADMAKEREAIMIAKKEEKNTDAAGKKKYFSLDEFGFGVFGLAVVLGILLGSIRIPLTSQGFSGATFSLGTTGGPLIMALILAHFGHIGRLSLRVPDYTLKVFRELGLMLFLIGAGVEGGVELVAQVSGSEYGVMLVVYGFLAGVVMTSLPMVVGYLLAKHVFKLPLLNNLGSITGGMTSTPALGTLVGVSGTDNVASAYASTYPVALVLVVIAANLIGTFHSSADAEDPRSHEAVLRASGGHINIL